MDTKPWNNLKIVTGIKNFISRRWGARNTTHAQVLENIRRAMLQSMGDPDVSSGSVVQLRVTYAESLQDLWYLRGDVMANISAAKGESVARTNIAEISELFKGKLPNGLGSRPSPLAD